MKRIIVLSLLALAVGGFSALGAGWTWDRAGDGPVWVEGE